MLNLTEEALKKEKKVSRKSTTVTRLVKEIEAMINTVQPTHLPSAKLFGQTSKTLITKPIIKFCAASHSQDVPEGQRVGRQANGKTELGENVLGPGRLTNRKEDLALGN